jgi:hypothetical protein
VSSAEQSRVSKVREVVCLSRDSLRLSRSGTVNPAPSRIGRGAQRAAVVLMALAPFVFLAPAVVRAAQIEPKGEIAATLAAGRAEFCVTRDAIVVATMGGGSETGSLPPEIVPVSSDRIAVVLGADEWVHPGSGKMSTRVDVELPRVAAKALLGRPPAIAASPDEPTEIEDIGIAVLEFLRPEVDQIHSHLDLAPDEPLVELLLADYAPGYGPEIWSLHYRVRQEDLGNGYWETRILRPAYYQLYPPEKGHPYTFMEARYPVNTQGPTWLAQLVGNNAQLERIAASSKEAAQAIEEIRKGDARKAHTAGVADLLRAALPDVGSNKAQIAVAQLNEQSGFQWLIAPRQPLPPPGPAQEPGAPSLRNYTPPKQQP